MSDFNTKLDEIVEHAYNAGYSAKDMVKQAIIDLIDKEIIDAIKVNQKGQFEDDAGYICWYLDDLENAMTDILKGGK